MPHNESFSRTGEHDLGADHEARQADRMDTGAGHVRAARLYRSMELRKRYRRFRLADLSQRLGELTGRTARHIGLVRAGIVDDLPRRDMPGSNLGGTAQDRD